MRAFRLTLATLPLALCALLTSCGANSSIPLTTISGNWSIYNINVERPAQPVLFSTMNGPITQSGNSLIATFHIQDACFGDGETPIPFTGSVNPENNHFTLNATSVDGETITVQGTFSVAKDTFLSSSLTFSGTCTGSFSALTGDEKGAILNPHGQKLPSLTGTWAPYVNELSSLNLVEQLTQTPTSDSYGYFALTGTVTIAGSPCFSTGTLQPASFVSGAVGKQIILLNDGSTLTTSIQVGAAGSNGTFLNLYPGSITGGNCNGPVDVDLQLASAP
jgi:hypothetical protein